MRGEQADDDDYGSAEKQRYGIPDVKAQDDVADGTEDRCNRIDMFDKDERGHACHNVP